MLYNCTRYMRSGFLGLLLDYARENPTKSNDVCVVAAQPAPNVSVWWIGSNPSIPSEVARGLFLEMTKRRSVN